MTKQNFIQGIAVAVALAVVVLFFLLFGNPLAGGALSGAVGAFDPSAAPTQLVIQDEVIGTGAEARVGDMLSVNYTGKLEDGTVFDTSLGRGAYPFVLGAGDVIQGWDQGLQGMKVGGKRLLIIPAALAYGSQSRGSIPPNSTLIFEVQLMSVVSQGQ